MDADTLVVAAAARRRPRRALAHAQIRSAWDRRQVETNSLTPNTAADFTVPSNRFLSVFFDAKLGFNFTSKETSRKRIGGTMKTVTVLVVAVRSQLVVDIGAD